MLNILYAIKSSRYIHTKLIVTESNFVRDTGAGPGADCGMPPRSPDTGNNTEERPELWL